MVCFTILPSIRKIGKFEINIKVKQHEDKVSKLANTNKELNTENKTLKDTVNYACKERVPLPEEMQLQPCFTNVKINEKVPYIIRRQQKYVHNKLTTKYKNNEVIFNIPECPNAITLFNRIKNEISTLFKLT